MSSIFPLWITFFMVSAACATGRPAAETSASSTPLTVAKKDGAPEKHPEQAPGAKPQKGPKQKPDAASEGESGKEAPPEGEAAEPERAPAAEHADDRTPTTCTYETYQWSRTKKGPANKRTVRKPYSEVTDAERDPADPSGCTVCSEDQEVIDLEALGFKGAKPIRVCRHYRARLETALREIAASGEFDMVDAVGYRPGMTRGPWVNDLRTVFSNHSFGTAIDINAAFNGMYTGCRVETLSVKSLRTCKLGIGGAWRPERHPRLTITKEGIVYRKITEHTGWKWGGELTGSIRDIMHFSITGK